MSLSVTACSTRGVIEYAEVREGVHSRDVFVAQLRQDTTQIKNFGKPRPDQLIFERITVSIPEDHEAGQIEWPRGVPDARTDFVAVARESYPNLQTFARAVAAADADGLGETAIHVHGYNTTHGEAVYGAAQVGFDLEIPVPTIVFSWPSAAQTKGYLYDRDSALISRDLLETLIVAFTKDPNRSLFLTAHSMGSHLMMETLRQISLSEQFDAKRRISGVTLLSPDIDTELFRTQAERIAPLPDPFVVVVAEQDQALRLSGLLTGRGARLGTLTNGKALDGLGITFVDVSALADGSGFDHKIGVTSPAAIAIFRRLNQLAAPGELDVVESVIAADQADGLLSRLVYGQ